MDRTAIMQEIARWPADEQIELVCDVWEQMTDAGWKPQLTKEQIAELDRRIAASEANPNDVVSWEDILNHVRRPR